MTGPRFARRQGRSLEPLVFVALAARAVDVLVVATIFVLFV